MFTPQAMPVMSELILDEQPLLCGDVLNYCPDIQSDIHTKNIFIQFYTYLKYIHTDSKKL